MGESAKIIKRGGGGGGGNLKLVFVLYCPIKISVLLNLLSV